MAGSTARRSLPSSQGTATRCWASPGHALWWIESPSGRPTYAAVITFGNLLLAFAMMLVIAAASSFIAARKVPGIDPFEIFRG